MCSENKGADQLRGYREADLRLCFRIRKKAGFLMTRLTKHQYIQIKFDKTKKINQIVAPLTQVRH